MLKLLANKVVTKNSRQARRCRTFGLLKYCVLNRSPQQTILVNPRDISANGVAFISDTSLPVKAILEIDIYMPPLNGFITVIAHVARVVKIKDSDRYLIGAHFAAMDPADRSRINDHIEKLAKDQANQQYLDKEANSFRRQIA